MPLPKKGPPGKFKPEKNNVNNNNLMNRVTNPTASVRNGSCTRCVRSKKFHLGNVKKHGLCEMPFCQKFFHSSTNCNQKNEEGIKKSGVNNLLSQDSTKDQGTISAL